MVDSFSLAKKSLVALTLGAVTSHIVGIGFTVPRQQRLQSDNWLYFRESSESDSPDAQYRKVSRGDEIIMYRSHRPHISGLAAPLFEKDAPVSLFECNEGKSLSNVDQMSRFKWSYHAPEGNKYQHVATRAVGWPFLSMRSCSFADANGNVTREGSVLLPPDLQTSSPTNTPHGALMNSVPLLPYWPGLLGNTVVYGGAWGGVLWVRHSIRAASRKRRGICTQCTYDLTGLQKGTPCPECGRKQ